MYRNEAVLRKIGVAVVGAAVLNLSACVESKVPLLTNAQPRVGQQFELHLYENFIEGKASDFHTSNFRWKDDRYVRASGLSPEAKSFVSQPLEGSDVIIQSADEDKLFNYWIARKIYDGVYLIFALDETDSDAATRNVVCAKDQPSGICMIQTHDQLITLARATAAKPVRAPALGVILEK